MKIGKAILVLTLFIHVGNLHAQITDLKDLSEDVLFIIDSIPQLEEPHKNILNIDPQFISSIDVYQGRDESILLGYPDQEGIVFIITKAFSSRDEKLKQIPSTAQMEKNKGLWQMKGAEEPYSGKFIDYYLDGRIKGDGTFEEGRLNGMRTSWFSNGNKRLKREFFNGLANGSSEEFFPNGQTYEEGLFLKGREEGKWKGYYPEGEKWTEANYNQGVLFGTYREWHPNGNLKIQTAYDFGMPSGEYKEWYSSGKLKYSWKIKSATYKYGKKEMEYMDLYSNGQDAFNQSKYQEAITLLTKAIKTENGNADFYLLRGRAYMSLKEQSKAIQDFSKSIQIEPLQGGSFRYRAELYIKIGKANPELVCSDLKKAMKYGKMTEKLVELRELYCH